MTPNKGEAADRQNRHLVCFRKPRQARQMAQVTLSPPNSAAHVDARVGAAISTHRRARAAGCERSAADYTETAMPIASVNETELFFVTAGHGLPCLVMHGGLGFDHTYLHPWLNPLGDTLHLVYYDHRGNGRSGRPAKETMTHAQLAADADALAAHLGFDQVAVIGHSYGGFIALEFALRYPQRLSHLILLDTAPAFNYPDEIMENARRLGATEQMLAILQAGFVSDDDMRQNFLVIWPLYFKTFDAEIGQRLLERSIINASGGAREGELAAYNVVPRLGEIRTPALVLVGRHDFICPPSQAHLLHGGLPRSELVIFEDSGHLPYVEEAEAFFTTVRGWIRRTA